MPIANPREIVARLSPAWYAAMRTLPVYKRDLTLITVLGGLAAGLETAGLGLIYVLILDFTGGDASGIVSLPLIGHYLTEPLAVTAASFTLLTAGIRIKYWVVRRASVISSHAGTYAGNLAINRARPLIGKSDLARQPPRYMRSLVAGLLKELPFASGFAAGGMSLAIIHIIQLFVILAVLLYLSPLLTVLLACVALITLMFLTTSYDSVIAAVDERLGNTSAFRQEVDDLGQALKDQSIDELHFKNLASSAFDNGRAHDHLRLRLAQRLEQQAGSLALEYVYPVAIVAISLMYIYTGEFAPEISEVALYFLLFRQAVSSFNVIGGVVMSVSRHHQPLTAFQELMCRGQLPAIGSLEVLQEEDHD